MGNCFNCEKIENDDLQYAGVGRDKLTALSDLVSNLKSAGYFDLIVSDEKIRCTKFFVKWHKTKTCEISYSKLGDKTVASIWTD